MGSNIGRSHRIWRRAPGKQEILFQAQPRFVTVVFDGQESRAIAPAERVLLQVSVPFEGDDCMSMHQDYSEVLLEHYRRPRNVGNLSRPDVVVTVGSPHHGDVMRLSLRIADGKVMEAGFKVFGCAAAIAAGSMTTEMIRGRSLEEVAAITNLQVAEALGGLPEGKIHCSVLAEQALRQALVEYGSIPPVAGRQEDKESDSVSGHCGLTGPLETPGR